VVASRGWLAMRTLRATRLPILLVTLVALTGVGCGSKPGQPAGDDEGPVGGIDDAADQRDDDAFDDPLRPPVDHRIRGLDNQVCRRAGLADRTPHGRLDFGRVR